MLAKELENVPLEITDSILSVSCLLLQLKLDPFRLTLRHTRIQEIAATCQKTTIGKTFEDFFSALFKPISPNSEKTRVTSMVLFHSFSFAFLRYSRLYLQQFQKRILRPSQQLQQIQQIPKIAIMTILPSQISLNPTLAKRNRIRSHPNRKM